MPFSPMVLVVGVLALKIWRFSGNPDEPVGSTPNFIKLNKNILKPRGEVRLTFSSKVAKKIYKCYPYTLFFFLFYFKNNPRLKRREKSEKIRNKSTNKNNPRISSQIIFVWCWWWESNPHGVATSGF